MAEVVARDSQSVTGRNILNIKKEFKLDPWEVPSRIFKQRYSGYLVPEEDMWRFPLLSEMLADKLDMERNGEDGDDLEDLQLFIEIICTL